MPAEITERRELIFCKFFSYGVDFVRTGKGSNNGLQYISYHWSTIHEWEMWLNAPSSTLVVIVYQLINTTYNVRGQIIVLDISGYDSNKWP